MRTDEGALAVVAGQVLLRCKHEGDHGKGLSEAHVVRIQAWDVPSSKSAMIR